MDDGGRKQEYCSRHAKSGMVDVRSKRCGHQRCTNHLSLGVDDGSKKADYSSQHARAGMVSVKNKRVPHGCITRPSVDISSAHTAGSSCQHAKEEVFFARRGTPTVRGDGGAARNTGDAHQSRAAPHRKRLAFLAQLTGVPASCSDGTSREKRARRTDVVRALGVPIKRDEEGLSADDAGGARVQQRPPQPTGGVLLGPTPLIRPVPGGGDTAVKTELIFRETGSELENFWSGGEVQQDPRKIKLCNVVVVVFYMRTIYLLFIADV